MALVTTLEHQQLERDIPHQAVRCTYSVVLAATGEQFLQLDTYGSIKRQIKGKKSQSIRFSIAALREIVDIARANKLI